MEGRTKLTPDDGGDRFVPWYYAHLFPDLDDASGNTTRDVYTRSALCLENVRDR